MLSRFSGNPILTPNNNWWESESVYNAGATVYNNKVILLYRAQGNDWISRIGMAESEDGFHFKRVSDLPVIEPNVNDPFERLGCEDPRITKIEDRYFITYTAASVYPAQYSKTGVGAKSLFRQGVPFRIRVSLAETRDFQFFERHGVLIPDLDAKNNILFPEKIDNQYVLFTRIDPNIVICTSPNMQNWTKAEFVMGPKVDSWEGLKIGSGSQPIKTKDGWLMFYHGVSKDKVYHLGAVLLDLKNPKIVLARTKNPILSPETSYEKRGLIHNVVFTCGAVEWENQYIIYYGGADKVLCAATIEKDLSKIF